VTWPDTGVTWPEVAVPRPEVGVTWPEAGATWPEGQLTCPNTGVTWPMAGRTWPSGQVAWPLGQVAPASGQIAQPSGQMAHGDVGEGAGSVSQSAIILWSLNTDSTRGSVPDEFDVFLSHNSRDKLAVEEIAAPKAEPLMRRVVTIFEDSLGGNHPNVATALNNLVHLLQATSRLSEAEPLMRRALAILLRFKRRIGHEHPHEETASGNYRVLLKEMGKTDAEIDRFRDARRQGNVSRREGARRSGRRRTSPTGRSRRRSGGAAAIWMPWPRPWRSPGGV
jgi:hypothetical protein